ncbi:MAG: UDP-N-acetylglucosamine diphosphorylase/glucosamine-1-phosphate N-acetyltransferase [bacterium TMED88]|nr:UDP-N-acetylglucosamine diphosphorylase/glucosamine-1-phosphate N-acetyltransferase [Deltaproteobacteria bacterium]OUV37284.1 MAG: UDP-N-acetylglucosamine diphosphorylase/glucosamine-1-phosphate N-acetyltransferase [bacterium TMED88]
MNREVAVVVLAAGKGTRMKSARVKVLHEICGLPMLGHTQRVAKGLEAQRLVVVIGREADEVRRTFGESAEFVHQLEQKGTGHAVMMAETALSDFAGDVFILYGDTPLLTVETLERMRALKVDRAADLVMLTARGEIPGRVVRDKQGRVERIVEAQDASPEELQIEERNTGVYLVSSGLLWAALSQIGTDNQQGELYLTDIVGYAVQKGHAVEALWLADSSECLGINDRNELAEATRLMQARINARVMASGVTLVDPATTYIDATAEIGPDTVIEPGCCIKGRSVIGPGVLIRAGCYIEDSQLDEGVQFGPYSHLRPGSHLQFGVKVGNFVEIKNSTLGPRSKSAHLTYIGDADVGADVNFGCGSVVVNYDGYQKHRSVVGDGAFVGCNVNLISPVRVSEKAFLAAGSTITQDVPEDALGVARARQRNLDGWVARKEGRSGERADSATPNAPDGSLKERGPGRAQAGETLGSAPGPDSERASGDKK